MSVGLCSRKFLEHFDCLRAGALLLQFAHPMRYTVLVAERHGHQLKRPTPLPLTLGRVCHRNSSNSRDICFKNHGCRPLPERPKTPSIAPETSSESRVVF